MLSLVAGEYPQGIDAGGKQVEVASLSGSIKGEAFGDGNPGARHPQPIRQTQGSAALEAATQGKGQVSQMPAFPRPGVFLVKAGDKEYCVSVRSSEKEGLTQFLGGSQVPAMTKIAHTVVDYDPAEELRKYQYGHSRTFELFLPLVLLATLALLAEGWLANPIRARSATTQPQNRHDAAETEKTGGSHSPPGRKILVGRGAG
jgi:hypothetical protein